MTRIAGMIAILLALAVAPSSVLAQKASPPKPLKHGTAVSATNVGPAAAGYASRTEYAGGEIKDGKAYAFARAVPNRATYDGFAIDGPHLLIESAAFTSALDIYATLPVVVRGVTIRSRTSGAAALLTRPGAGPVYVLWSELAAADGARVDAGAMLRADRATLYRSHVSGAADGVQISGSHNTLIENLIEVRRAEAGDHNDAVQMLGAPSHISLTRNRILNANPQTSCVTILGNDIRLQDNALSGGGWSLYGGARNNGKSDTGASRVRVTGTVFGRDYFPKAGSFGPVSYWDKANVWMNNRFDNGKPVTP